jgi:hypothetical protein
MRIHSLSAVIFTSADPDRLAAFYNEHLGLGFARRAHGPTADHHEARIGDMRFAILPDTTSQAGASRVSPTFLVNGLDDFRSALIGAGIEERAPVRSLGDRKRLASFKDIDGNGFQLIDLGFTV